MNTPNPPFAFHDSRWGKPVLVWPVVRQYQTGELAIQLISRHEDGWEEPWATATVALWDTPARPNHVWLKTWSENDGLVELLESAGIIKPGVTRFVPLSYDAVAEEYELTLPFISFVHKESGHVN